jgi:hypothetical protein
MRRYLGFASLLAIAVAFAAFVLGIVFPLLPSPIVAAVLFLCPSYALMAATAACEAFDPCSLNMLVWVVGLNVGIYCLLATTLWLTRQRWRAVRFGVFGVSTAASAWWAAQWVR